MDNQEFEEVTHRPAAAAPVAQVAAEPAAAGAPAAGDPAGDAAHREVRLAMLNAVKLSLSLVATIAVAVIVRIYVPRYFKPAGFGQYSFAEAYAATFFSFATFGIDTYIRKEVATRREHADEFYAGAFLLRLAAAALILVAMALYLWHDEAPSIVWQLSFIFAAGQVAFVDNTTLSAFLQAAGEVTELSWANVIAKILWCAGIFISLALGGSILWVAIWFTVSEALKTFYLMFLAHHRLGLRWQVDGAKTWGVVKASAPFFLNNIALSIYAKINVILLARYSSDTEVGWYGAAMTIAGFSLLFLPVLQAVIMPLAARTARASVEAMNEVMRSGTRLMVVSGTLISLVLWLHADFIAVRAFGGAYAEAAAALRMIAPMFPLTYMATVGSLHLIQQNRNWSLMRVSLFAVVVNPLVNVPLIRLGVARGPGQAGAMSALATVITEAVVLALTLGLLGRAGVDRKFFATIARRRFCAPGL